MTHSKTKNITGKWFQGIKIFKRTFYLQEMKWSGQFLRLGETRPHRRQEAIRARQSVAAMMERDRIQGLDGGHVFIPLATLCWSPGLLEK